MFNLIRRISYGVIPRPDRPWEEDPTSNAPQTGRKRRLSSTERDVQGDDDQANKKKARAESATPSVADAEGSSSAFAPQADTQEVKDVTQGVKGVDLDGKDAEAEAVVLPDEGAAAPENVPLPDEKSGELDEPASDGVDVPAEASVSVSAPESEVATKEGDEDVQSSSGEEATLPEGDKAETAAPVAADNELTTESPSTADADATTKD